MSHAPGGSVGPLANPVAFAHYSPAVLLGAFMSVFRTKRFAKRSAKRFAKRSAKRFSIAFFAAVLIYSALPTAGHAYTPEEQQACQGDAFRLCGPEIPDVDRVTACMVSKRSQLSPACAVYFRHGPAIRAASRKPHKSRKPIKHTAT